MDGNETDAEVKHESVVARKQPGYLQELLDAKGIGVEMAAGIDLDDYLRQVREGRD